MGRKAKGKHRLDKYYYLAKEQGFRSRAAFKLVQLNRKYDFLSKARACMDLCAAPGGWLQVAQKYMPMSSTIVGVDLAPIRPIRGVTTLVEDITTQSCRAALKRVTPKGLKYDVVIHDGAPNVGGNFAKESYTQAALTLDSLRLATEFLGPGGWFVTKVFRSVEYHALLYACQQLFKKVESTKPVASRGTSAEIYVVCSGYLAPTKIDPRLLDAKHLFADTEAEIQPIDVTKDNGKRKRNRSGYEDGVSTLYKECAAEEFIVNDKPGEMLGSHHTFILDGRNRKGLVPPKEGWMDLDNHPTTTDEIRSLVSDLGVLGKADFKLLLRWRMTIRKQTGLEKKKHRRGEDASSDEESSDDDDDDENDDDDDDENEGADEKDQLLNEMSELKNSIDAQARRDKKKKAKLRAKERLRVARGLAASGEAIVEQEMDLFSLARIKTAKALDVVSKAPAPGSAAAYDSDEDPDEEMDSDGSDSDTEEDERRLDKEVDQMWAMYKARRSKKGEKFTEPSKGRDQRTQIGAGELADESSDEEDEDEPSDPADDEFKSDSDELEWDTDQGEDEDEPVGKKSKSAKTKDANPLLVELEKKKGKSAAKAADMWFSNDLFASKKKTSSSNANDAAADSSDSEEEDEAPKPAKRGKKSSKKNEDSDDDDFDDLRAKAKRAKDAKAEADAKAKKATKKAKATGGKGGAKYDDTYDDDDDDESDDDKPSSRRGNKKKGDDDFEVVAAERDASSGSDSDESDGYGYDSEVDELSDDTRARILALGKKMIRKKDREELIEDGYNRYAFDDDDLPDWFAEDERRFMKPVPQYTTEELAAAKAELAAVNTRPIKKVAEAKWRKKKRAEAKMAAARSRAAAIIEQDDVPDVSKAKEIERVFAKARRTAKGNPKKTKAPVVARKFHRGNAGGPSVDKRQLADLRGQKNAAKRAKQRGGGKSGGRGGGGKRKSGGKR